MSESCCYSTPQGSNPVPLADFKESPGEIPEISARLTWRDRLGMFKFRWGIRRMGYSISPGLYKIGKPDGNSPVLVTSNLEMTFDLVRSQLDGIDAWMPVH